MPFSLSRRPGVASRRSVVVAAATGVALAASAASASAATFCVTDSSSTAGCDATFTSATLNPVQQAVDAAKANAGPDTVRIAAGTWTGNVSESSGLTEADETTTIVGAGSGSTTLTAPTAAVMQLGGAYLISGLTIAGVDPGSPALGLGITRGSDLVVRRADDPSNVRTASTSPRGPTMGSRSMYRRGRQAHSASTPPAAPR